MNTGNEKIEEASKDDSARGYKLGIVHNNVDPENQNRIQCTCPDLFDPAQSELPWLAPSPYSPFGIGPGFGVYGSPAIGASVKIYLQDGNSNYGFYESSLLTRANVNPKFAAPSTWGYKDPSGNELFVDMATGNWQFTHSSGIFLGYDSTGTMTAKVPGNSNTTVNGNTTETTKGNFALNITGNADIKVTGATSVTSETAITLTAPLITMNG